MLKKITLALYVALILLMGYATFLERSHGNDYAGAMIYRTWWFSLLWGLLSIGGMMLLARHKVWKNLPVMLLHVSLLLILAGALVTHLTGREGIIHLRQGIPERSMMLRESRTVEPLPFTLTLDSFEVACYAGTQAHSDYISHVSYQPEGEAVKTATISMNHILTIDGYRLYQSQYDMDRLGTVLTVNSDPIGTSVTYVGYALLGLSVMALLLVRGGTFRKLLRQLSAQPKMTAALVLTALSLSPAPPASARGIPAANEKQAAELARRQVIHNDRVAPFNTLARDFLRKIYGKDRYKGLNAEQVVSGWMARPDVWKDEPMIRIKDTRLRHYLGIDDRYASFAQLFDAQENYKLQDFFEHTNGGAAAMGESPDAMLKAATELDEKAGLILMLVNGTLVNDKPADVPSLSATAVEAELLYNSIPFTKILFMANLTLGFLTFILMIAGKTRLTALFRYLLGASLLFALMGYALRWYISGRIPLGNGYETMLFLSVALMLTGLLVSRRFPFTLPFGFLLSGFTLLVSYLGEMNPQITPLMPVLQSPLLSSHVSVIMISYALLSFLFLNGLVYLLQHHRLRRADEATATALRQQLNSLDLLSHLMLYPALFLLAAGIFLGAVWANVSWGSYWSWDPKEVWALITLMTYALPIHSKSLPRFRKPVFFHLYLCLAFLLVPMTYFGVNYLIGGMHSYAG